MRLESHRLGLQRPDARFPEPFTSLGGSYDPKSAGTFGFEHRGRLAAHKLLVPEHSMRGAAHTEPMAGQQVKKDKVAKTARKSGRYKKGARQNRTDKYTPKSELKRMKAEEMRLQAEVSSLSKRVKILEEELLAERNERLSLEATLEVYQGRNRRGRRDLLHG